MSISSGTVYTVERFDLVGNPNRLQARTASRWLGGYAAWTLENGQKTAWYDGAVSSVRAVRERLKKQRMDGVLTIHPELAETFTACGVLAAALNDIGVAGVAVLRAGRRNDRPRGSAPTTPGLAAAGIRPARASPTGGAAW